MRGDRETRGCADAVQDRDQRAVAGLSDTAPPPAGGRGRGWAAIAPAIVPPSGIGCRLAALAPTPSPSNESRASFELEREGLISGIQSLALLHSPHAAIHTRQHPPPARMGDAAAVSSLSLACRCPGATAARGHRHVAGGAGKGHQPGDALRL